MPRCFHVGRWLAALGPPLALFVAACAVTGEGGRATPGGDARPGDGSPPAAAAPGPLFDRQAEDHAVEEMTRGLSPPERQAQAGRWQEEGARAFALGDPARAARLFYRAIRVAGDEPQVSAHRNYQEAMLALGRGEELRREYDALAGAMGAGHAPIGAYLRSVLIDDHREAIALLESALAEGEPRLEPLRLRYLYHGIAVRHLEAGNLAAAQGAFLRAIEASPLWAEPRLGLARALARDNHRDAALARMAREELQFAGDAEWVLSHLQLLVDARRHEEAVEACARAEARFPGDFRFRGIRVHLLAAAGKRDEAAALLNDLLDHQLKTRADWAAVGLLFDEWEQREMARKVYARAIAAGVDPEFFAIRMGASFEADGALDEAIVFYRGCRLRYPDQTYFSLALGDACRVAADRLGADLARPREAGACYREARDAYDAYLAGGGPRRAYAGKQRAAVAPLAGGDVP